MRLAINVALTNNRFLSVGVAHVTSSPPRALKAYYPLTRSRRSYPRSMPSRFSVIFVFVDASAATRGWISANGNPVGKARGITRGSDVVFTTGTRCDAPRHLLRVCSLVWSLSALHLTLICLASTRRVCPISRVYVQETRNTGPRFPSSSVIQFVCEGARRTRLSRWKMKSRRNQFRLLPDRDYEPFVSFDK